MMTREFFTITLRTNSTIYIKRDRKEGNVSQQGQPLLIVAGFEIWIATKLNILFFNLFSISFDIDR
jgi:hypothetical protein